MNIDHIMIGESTFIRVQIRLKKSCKELGDTTEGDT
jgi:hypothetical protein